MYRRDNYIWLLRYDRGDRWRGGTSARELRGAEEFHARVWNAIIAVLFRVSLYERFRSPFTGFLELKDFNRFSINQCGFTWLEIN